MVDAKNESFYIIVYPTKTISRKVCRENWGNLEEKYLLFLLHKNLLGCIFRQIFCLVGGILFAKTYFANG